MEIKLKHMSPLVLFVSALSFNSAMDMRKIVVEHKIFPLQKSWHQK